MNKLDHALQNTSKTVGIQADKELVRKIEHWQKKGIVYGVFPTVGDSMTCDDSRTIPENSHVLANQIKRNDFLSLPINKPLLIEIKGVWHKHQFVCKTISLIDDTTKRIRLTSYNPEHKDVFIPYIEVGRVFEIQKVFLPNTLTV